MYFRIVSLYGRDIQMNWYKKIIRSRETRLAIMRLLSFIPDRVMIRVLYFIKTGHLLHLKNPRRYTEKLQWYKLNYRNPLMIQCVDKYDVRDYIKKIGYGSLLNKLLGVYEDPNDIAFDEFPESFVLKDTLGSGGNSVIICTDKTQFDVKAAKKQMEKWIALNPRQKSGGREWPYYSGKKHRIIAETFITSDPAQGGLIDYKFFCFNGRAEFLYGIADRVVGKVAGFGIYDRDFNLLPYTRTGENRLEREIGKPANFNEMREIAQEISKPFPHARIDLYDQDGKIIFGEITFFSGSGYISFEPDVFDNIMGDKWRLQKESPCFHDNREKYTHME